MNYQLLDKIGQGGMGQVFKAMDLGLELEVAVKFMDPALAQDEVSVKRFLEEARKLAKIDHPNIVRVMAAGKWTDGRPYFVMELLRGQPLSDILKRGALAEDEVIRISKDVLSALDAAHRNGIIHRDIKSSNIFMCEDGRIKVIDFGIARDEAASSVSVFGKPLGTPAYMSPEQALGERATPQSDLYSLGIVMYEMLAGFRPFRAESPVALIRMHVDVPVPDLPSDVSMSLRAVISKALRKDATARYYSAMLMAEALTGCLVVTAVKDELPKRLRAETAKIQAPPLNEQLDRKGFWEPPRQHVDLQGHRRALDLGSVNNIVNRWQMAAVLAILIAAGALPVAWTYLSQNQRKPLVYGEASVKRITTDSADDQDPAAGTDGRILFSSNRDGNSDVYVMDSDGSNVRRLYTNASFDGNPAWGPDGKVAFESKQRDRNTIIVMNADGSIQRQVTNDNSWASSPAWSSDGRIAFAALNNVNWELFAVNTNSYNLHQLTDNSATDRNPTWGPGGQIAFESDRDGNWEIYIVEPDGSNIQRLTEHSASDRNPSWGPDGRIAFESERDGNWEIYTVDPDGSNINRITENSASDRSPSWGSDGLIVFESYRDGNWEIYTIQVPSKS